MSMYIFLLDHAEINLSKDEVGRLSYNMTISQCIILQNDFDKDNFVEEDFLYIKY